MISQKQIQANRQNAQESTGPVTAAGKEKVSRNAIRHGLCCGRDVLVLGEDPAELQGLREGLIADLRPVGMLERILVGRVTAAAWRLRRIARIEAEMMCQDLTAENRYREKAAPMYKLIPGVDLGLVIGKDLCNRDKYSKLGRYESRIERGMFRALHELQRLQAVRAGREVSLPEVVEVNLEVAAAGADAAEPGEPPAETKNAKQSHFPEDNPERLEGKDLSFPPISSIVPPCEGPPDDGIEYSPPSPADWGAQGSPGDPGEPGAD